MSEIQVYARLKPLSPKSSRYERLSIQPSSIKISVGDKQAEKFTNSHYNEHFFRFKNVFDEHTTQDQVFDDVAVEMIDKFLEGFNSTLFAYGQTASGKTYTIEGGARQFKERGLIPRAISYIYSALGSRKQQTAADTDEVESAEEINTIHISYIEIYQDTGYDLLNPGCRNDGMLLNLPKVSVSEGHNGQVLIRNLSSHLASNEEVALSLLFQGSTCRRVAETSMNLSSSRSHAIFTFTLTSQKQGSELRTRSKLNLVDLAGSERVFKTCATGQVLQEAKHINLSLHHLEHVIVVLQKHSNKSQPVTPASSADTVNSQQKQQSQNQHRFVPYRNSLLTMILRDSLGGNCITAMISNLSLDKVNLMETISTCRFAQRVACISNRARRNEEFDDKVLIRKLKEKIHQLKQEIETLKTNVAVSNDACMETQSTKELDQEKQKKNCHRVLYDFLHGKITDPVAAGINNPLLFTEALTILKDVILHTVKETKNRKQEVTTKNQSRSRERDDRKTVSSPFSTSISPQSQISSGFVSLKDDDLLLDYCYENRQRPSEDNARLSVQSPSDEQHGSTSISTPRQVRLISPRTQTKRSQTHSTLVHSLSTTTLDPEMDKKIRKRKLLLSPEKDRMECPNHVMQVDGDRSVGRNSKSPMKPAHNPVSTQESELFQQFKSHKAELQQHVMDELKLRKNPQIPRNTALSPVKDSSLRHRSTSVDSSTSPTQTNETNDLRLLTLQKELELKEAATRKRLLALKLELQGNGFTTTDAVIPNTPSCSRNSVAEIANRLKNPHHASVRIDHNPLPDSKETKLIRIVQSKNDNSDDHPKRFLSIKQSPQKDSEKLYSKALDTHKNRVNQIRQCIKSAIIIQRAWRKYKRVSLLCTS